MEIIRETKPLLYSSNEIYDYVIKIDNYEAILGSEIKNFEKLNENQFKIKIGSMPNICLELVEDNICLLYTSPSPRDRTRSRMPSSA